MTFSCQTLDQITDGWQRICKTPSTSFLPLWFSRFYPTCNALKFYLLSPAFLLHSDSLAEVGSMKWNALLTWIWIVGNIWWWWKCKSQQTSPVIFGLFGAEVFHIVSFKAPQHFLSKHDFHWLHVIIICGDLIVLGGTFGRFGQNCRSTNPGN